MKPKKKNLGFVTQNDWVGLILKKTIVDDWCWTREIRKVLNFSCTALHLESAMNAIFYCEEKPEGEESEPSFYAKLQKRYKLLKSKDDAATTPILEFLKTSGRGNRHFIKQFLYELGQVIAGEYPEGSYWVAKKQELEPVFNKFGQEFKVITEAFEDWQSRILTSSAKRKEDPEYVYDVFFVDLFYKLHKKDSSVFDNYGWAYHYTKIQNDDNEYPSLNQVFNDWQHWQEAPYREETKRQREARLSPLEQALADLGGCPVGLPIEFYEFARDCDWNFSWSIAS